MKLINLSILLLILSSCASKKYTKIYMLPNDIKSATEESYLIENNSRKLINKKILIFTKNGRIKTSMTVDSIGNILQKTEKKLWFVKESYPDKEAYYCKTRWKPKQRERISCYTQKQYKQNEAIYNYNKDGAIHKIVDNFTTFNTQYFYYANNELSKIIVKDKNDTLINEIQIKCVEKDAKGTCIKQIRESKQPYSKKEIRFTPIY